MNRTLLFIFFLLPFFVLAQTNNIDSLIGVVKTTTDDSVKVQALTRIAFHYIFSDSAKAVKYINQGMKLSEERHVPYGMVSFNNVRGIFYDVKGVKDSAYYYFNRALTLNKKYKYPDLEVRILNNLGMNCRTSGKLEEAQAYFFKALKTNHKLPKEQQTSDIKMLSNIGLIYQDQGLMEKALKYHRQALQLRIEEGIINELPISYNNIGVCYLHLNKIDSAILVLQQGIQIAIQHKDHVHLGKLYQPLANCYVLKKRYNDALNLYLERLKVPGNVLSTRDFLISYEGITGCYIQLKDYDNAVIYVEKALKIMAENPELEEMAQGVYTYRANLYYIANQPEKGLEYNLISQRLIEKIYSKETAQKFSEMEVKYKTEKKEQENKLLKEETKREQLALLFTAIGILALLIIIVLIIRARKQREKTLRLEAQLRETQVIETANKEKERISRDLHDNVGAQLSFLISNLEWIAQHPETSTDKDVFSNRLNTLSESGRNAILTLRETIWAVSHQELTMEDFADRFKQYVLKMTEFNQELKITFKETINNNIPLSPVNALNTFRICQEAFHNALKHSQCTHIIIDFKAEESNLKFTIIDDGIGFDPNREKDEHYGLANMKSRAAEMNGKLTIESSLNKGTTLILKVPYTN